jgi:serine/threonine-protein kinase
MDCATCYYPNEDEARFCARCAAPLSVPVSRLPTEAAPAPEPVVADALLHGSGFGSPEQAAEALAEALAAAEAQRQAMGAPRAEPAVADHSALYGGPLLGGRYRLLRCLGSGGFGAVYEAEDARVGLRVAIKLLNRSGLIDRRTRERFLQEARMIAALRSPHVVALHDYEVTPAGVPYLVMELLRGRPLCSDMMRGVLAPRRSLHIMAQVCAALGEAHAEGIVHRDIKSDNVLLVPRPQDPDFVKVVDFGVARLFGPDTRPSDVLGTPAYIAPETLAGEPVDGRCDLYAVGMLLWQMVVGALPFPGETSAIMMRSHLEAPRRWPRQVVPALGRALPDELEELMRQLVARRPAERPQSAFSVRAQLLELVPRVSDRPLQHVPLPNFGPSWDARTESSESAASRAEAPTRRSEDLLESLGSQAPTQRRPFRM